MIGKKFEDAESLAKSYECLEREFTKKCQELARVKKELESEEVLSVTDGGNEEKSEEREETLVSELVQEGNDEIPLSAESGMEEEAEAEEKDCGFNPKEEAAKFLTLHPEAKNYAKEIAKELLCNKTLLNLSDPFYLAYLIVKDKLNIGGSVKTEDGKKGEELKEDVSRPVYPKLLKGTRADGIQAPSRKKYESLEDARADLISRYFS